MNFFLANYIFNGEVQTVRFETESPKKCQGCISLTKGRYYSISAMQVKSKYRKINDSDSLIIR